MSTSLWTIIESFASMGLPQGLKDGGFDRLRTP
jgi:hypothetical protein